MHSKRRWFAAMVSLLPGGRGRRSRGPAEEHGARRLINIDKVLIIQAINFVILLFVLHRLSTSRSWHDGRAVERDQESLEEAQAPAGACASRKKTPPGSRRPTPRPRRSTTGSQEAAEEQRRLVEGRAESQRMMDPAKAQLDADVRRAREELRVR